MSTIAIIPARGGSKGVPRKNIKRLAGKPLIQYTIDAAKRSDVFDEIMVSTEDAEIAEIASQCGANTPFLRPPRFATDQAKTIDVVIHVLKEYLSSGQSFDNVCLLQPTTPFRSAVSIIKSVAQFQKSNHDSLISVREVPHEFNPHWVFEDKGSAGRLVIATGEKEIISRRQDLPKAYYRDGSIYLVNTSIVLERQSLYGDSIGFIVLDSDPCINIDTIKDWERAEQYAMQTESKRTI